VNDSKVLEVKVGITILVGVTMLVLGIVWLKGITFKPNTFEVPIVFGNTAGLQIGDPVTVSGMKIGKVTDINLEGDSVVVMVSLSNSVKLKTDVAATITSTDFFGGKKVEMVLGKDETKFDLSKRIPGSREPDLTELTSQLKEIAVDVKGTLQRVDSVLYGINSVVGDKSFANSLKRAVYNLDSTTARIKLIATRSDGKIDSILTRLSFVSKGFKTMVEKTDGKLDSTFGNVAEITKTVAAITNSLNEVTKHIESGQGTLGKLVYDDGIYKKINQAVDELDSLVKAVRESGMKVNFQLFGD